MKSIVIIASVLFFGPYAIAGGLFWGLNVPLTASLRFMGSIMFIYGAAITADALGRNREHTRRATWVAFGAMFFGGLDLIVISGGDF